MFELQTATMTMTRMMMPMIPVMMMPMPMQPMQMPQMPQMNFQFNMGTMGNTKPDFSEFVKGSQAFWRKNFEPTETKTTYKPKASYNNYNKPYSSYRRKR